MDENILIRITGEADLTDAQIQVKELQERNKELTKQMQEVTAAEKADVANIRAWVKDEKKADAEIKKTTASYYSQKKAIMEKQTANDRDINSLKKSINAYNMLNGAGGGMRTQLMAMREELNKMADAGDMSSDEFINLSVAAAKLQDQIGDTQQTITILADDNKGLTAAMSAGSGLVGAFNAGISAMALFGDESEKLNKAFLKVQATMAILNGVQQVANTLNHESAARVVLRAAAAKVFGTQLTKNTVQQTANNAATTAGVAAEVADTGAKTADAAATGVATKAQLSLNAAMAANPIGAVITVVVAATAAIAALGYMIYSVIDHFSDEAKAERAYQEQSEKTEAVVSATTRRLNAMTVKREKALSDLEIQQNKAMAGEKARGASSVSIAESELQYAKERKKIIGETLPEAYKKQKKAVDEMQKSYEKLKDLLSETDVDSDDYKDRLQELTNISSQLKSGREELISMQQQNAKASDDVTAAEQALADAKKEMALKTNQARIDAMKDGEAKELAQIKADYDEQMKTLNGETDEEIALRKALEAKKAKEIAEVKRKYKLQEQETEVQMAKNLAAANPADVEAAKKAEDAEYKYKIASLDKQALGVKAYNAQVEALRIEHEKNIKAIDDEDAERKAELAKKTADKEIAEAERAVLSATDSKTAVAAYENLYSKKKELATLEANEEIANVTRSEQNEQMRSAKIEEIRRNLNTTLSDIEKERLQSESDVINSEKELEITKAQNVAQETLASVDSTYSQIQAAREASIQADRDAFDQRESALNESYANHLISYQEYNEQMEQLTHDRNMYEIELERQKLEEVTKITESVLDTVGQMVDTVFGAFSDAIDAQIDELDEMYTTDADEAAKDNKKKLISEEELEKKKAALKLKQQKLDKANAIFQIGLSTAMAIMRIWADTPKVDFGASTIALTVLTAAIGAAQLAAAAAKPLSQYAKGRKGGEGEYAIVGERGAELMYVPEGASIVPHNKLNNPVAWGEYGIPTTAIPAVADYDKSVQDAALMQSLGFSIDYDRLGKAVADNIPAQNAFNVNIDRSGISVSHGGDTHTYLNKKYQAQWN